MLELMIDTGLTAEQRDYLKTARESADALLTLLNDILDFSKIEAGHLDLEQVNFDLRSTVEGVAVNMAQRAEAKGLEMACLIMHDVPATVRGDPGRLRQVLVNLAGNAIKFTLRGEVVIRVANEAESETHVTLRFSVSDTGVGIPRARQGAIFERFVQVDSSTTRKFGGTGLGLTISKQLVEMMGGTIGIESEVGVGSTFWFTGVFEKQPEFVEASTSTVVDIHDMHVLVVDDNGTNRMILTKMLENFGCRINSISSGKEAVKALRSSQERGDPYRLVLLDLQMPEMDGEQTLTAIKADPNVREVTVIILTSMGHRGDAARLEALGCAGYLLKPIKQAQLYDAILAVFGQRLQITDEIRSQLITRHTLSEQKRQSTRILLAEDNPINQKLAITLLQKAGYPVDVVENGVQAVEGLKAKHYHLVLMDVQMPEMDGFEATQRIREYEAGKSHIPIIAMTAHAMKGDRERCLAAGMDDYLSKPIEPQELFDKISQWAENENLPNKLSDQAGNNDVLLTMKDAKLITKDEHTLEEGYQDPSRVYWEANPALSFEGTALDEDLDEEDLLDDDLTVHPDQFEHESPPSGVSSLSKSEQAPSPPEKTKAVDGAVLDIQSALPRFNYDRKFFIDMFQEFVGQLPERVAELNNALLENNAQAVNRLGHNLKGVAASFAALHLAELAQSLETCGRTEDLSDVAGLIDEVKIEIPKLVEYLEDINNHEA
jgi:CheY-like chemotaxis protein/HPt (histidine-containing phosphotransfer) domain-containing protein